MNGKFNSTSSGSMDRPLGEVKDSFGDSPDQLQEGHFSTPALGEADAADEEIGNRKIVPESQADANQEVIPAKRIRPAPRRRVIVPPIGHPYDGPHHQKRSMWLVHDADTGEFVHGYGTDSLAIAAVEDSGDSVVA